MKLIPVIELGYGNQGVEVPENGPYWEYPDDWDQFNQASYRKAGFKDDFEPFDPGSSLYETDRISDKNLTKIVLDHTQELRSGEYRRDDVSPFFGGYILQIEGENLFYPQCCGDLGDIQFWRNISLGEESYYEGHPAPLLRFEDEDIVFDLNLQAFHEEFTPRPLKRIFRCKRVDLISAIQVCELALERLAKRIQFINDSHDLNLNNIEDLLVWENLNYE